MEFPSNLFQKLDMRRRDGSYRSLTLRDDLIDFASNDYLGFSGNEFINTQIEKEMKLLKPNLGSTGSRLISGNYDFHEKLEIQLSEFFGTEGALLFNSGYDANIGLLSSIPQRGDHIFYDEYSHASIRDGIRLSHAKAFSFKHNDIQDLLRKIERIPPGHEVYVVVESIYSMDGDAAPLKELAELAGKRSVKLIVDEAHATGIFGPGGQGLVMEYNLGEDIFARVHTFGKALGCHGAVVVGSQILRSYLINYARSFIYTTAMPLHQALTIKFAMLALADTMERERLKDNIDHFRSWIRTHGIEDQFINSVSPIQSFVINSPLRIKEISAKLREQKFDAKAILSPTVPRGKERIRFCIHSYNTYDEIQEILFLLSTFV